MAISPETDHTVDIVDRARPMQPHGGSHFPWRWVLIPSVIIVGLIWVVSVFLTRHPLFFQTNGLTGSKRRGRSRSK